MRNSERYIFAAKRHLEALNSSRSGRSNQKSGSIQYLSTQPASLPHVFSTDAQPILEDVQGLDEMRLDAPTASFEDVSWYGSDLALAPLPELQQSERSLREAAALAQKMALARSMSTEADALSASTLSHVVTHCQMSVSQTSITADGDIKRRKCVLPCMTDGNTSASKSMGLSGAKSKRANKAALLPSMAFPTVIPTSSLMHKGAEVARTAFPGKLNKGNKIAAPGRVGQAPLNGGGKGTRNDSSVANAGRQSQPASWKDHALKSASKIPPPKPVKSALLATPKKASKILDSPGVETKVKKRRVVKKDPNRQRSKPWTEAELMQFRQVCRILVIGYLRSNRGIWIIKPDGLCALIPTLSQLLQDEGPTGWSAKAEKLGTGRTAKSLHTRWLRDEGRIVDRPRGLAAVAKRAENV